MRRVRSVDGKPTVREPHSNKDPPGHGENPILRTARLAKDEHAARKSVHTNRQISEPQQLIPKTGCMYTDFWHTVQFSRSGTRPTRAPHPQARLSGLQRLPQGALARVAVPLGGSVRPPGPARRTTVVAPPPAVNLRACGSRRRPHPAPSELAPTEAGASSLGWGGVGG